MHDYLYEHQQELDDKHLRQYASALGIWMLQGLMMKWPSIFMLAVYVRTLWVVYAAE
jgi:hypothetical protein